MVPVRLGRSLTTREFRNSSNLHSGDSLCHNDNGHGWEERTALPYVVAGPQRRTRLTGEASGRNRDQPHNNIDVVCVAIRSDCQPSAGSSTH
jgi:hypothetical protein